MAADGRWERWERTIRDPKVDPLEVLTVSGMYQRYFDAVQREAVRVARAEGRSWADIADAAGITKQSAWEKWKDVSQTGEDLQRRVDEMTKEQVRKMHYEMGEQIARLAESGELRQQANELRKAVLALKISNAGKLGP